MNWPYHFTPYVWPSLITVIFLIALASYGWHQRGVPGALPFVAACIFASLWGFGGVLENAAADAATKFAWVRFQGVWQLPTATAVLCFILEYAYPGRWLNGRNLAVLSIAPLIVFLLVLLGRPYELVLCAGFTATGDFIRPIYSAGYWVLLGYGYLLTLLNFVVFVWLAVHSPAQRWPVVLMALGQILARFFLFADFWGGDLAPHIRAFFPPFVFPFGMYAVALFSFRIFDPIPLARRTALERMRAAVIVVDPRGWVLSLNPSAERLLGMPESQARQRPVQSLLPSYMDETVADGAETEIMLGDIDRGELRHCVLAVLPLKDWRGLDLGRLLLLRDVTEQRRAQTRLGEQARALAVLQERERLARELHDDLGQVLGYAKMQAQAAHDHLARGRADDANKVLERLVAAIQDAHDDIREYILGASSSKPGALRLVPALQQYLRAFSEAYGIRTELSTPAESTEAMLDPTVEVQLLRIVQEALTNVRKHAHATSVRVRVSLQDGRAEVLVQDDGIGFNTAGLERRQRQRFGLAFMRERAGEVGGTVEIESAPGAGTRMIVAVPLSLEATAKA